MSDDLYPIERCAEGLLAIMAFPAAVDERIARIPGGSAALADAAQLGGGVLVEMLGVLLAVGGASALEAWRAVKDEAEKADDPAPILAFWDRFDLAIDGAPTLAEAEARAAKAFGWGAPS